MKKFLLELLVCPACLPDEVDLTMDRAIEHDGDISHGSLACPRCSFRYPIRDGIANLAPENSARSATGNRYETAELVSSYLWSHFSDLADDPACSQAYRTWAGQLEHRKGLALDVGCAVGRFTFEMSSRSDFAIGVDTSTAFITAARQLMRQRTISTAIKDEGLLSRTFSVTLPQRWAGEKVEFLVADALRLPFRRNIFASSASLNLVDKVASPLRHLREINRVTRDRNARFLLSDPFSWSGATAPPEAWLGGRAEGPYRGKGRENIAALLQNPQGQLTPAWEVCGQGEVWWKIRTHTNHYELIRSCFLNARR